ncbi:MAG: PilZ domain-containing protein [Alphaproteobacteria bacterium]
MLKKIANSFARDESAVPSPTNRQFPRRSDDRCVGVVNGQMHPVENWSKGGMLIMADERLFSVGQDCVFTLKFRLRDEIVEVDHHATVIRKAPGKVAFQFDPLSNPVQTNFQKVVDDYVSRRFVDSQL